MSTQQKDKQQQSSRPQPELLVTDPNKTRPNSSLFVHWLQRKQFITKTVALITHFSWRRYL